MGMCVRERTSGTRKVSKVGQFWSRGDSGAKTETVEQSEDLLLKPLHPGCVGEKGRKS